MSSVDGKSASSTSGVACFSGKGQLVNISGFAGRMVSGVTTQLCGGSAKAAIDNIGQTGCVPVKFYLRTLKVEFFIIFMCQEILYFFLIFFPQPFKNTETILAL